MMKKCTITNNYKYYLFFCNIYDIYTSRAFIIHPPFSNDDESTSSFKKSFSRRSKDVDQSYKRPLAVGGSLVLTGRGKLP